MNPNPDTIAAHLRDHPDFFNHYPEVLEVLTLTSPHGQRTVSLQERQMELLRDKVRALELKLAELIRYGQDNDAIAEKINRLVRLLFIERDPLALPELLAAELKRVFAVPAVAVRLWGVAIGGDRPWAGVVDPDTRLFASSLMTPYCGPNSGFEAVGWLGNPADFKSVVLVPLRIGAAPEAFGLLVMGSPDAGRFSSDMGVTYLARIEEIAAAALSSLLQAAR
jgi:uncharacterized protein YigA (DUF484 family)